jgi:hypothetical protein
LAFPNHDTFPAELSQLLRVLRVPLTVARQLWGPIYRIALRYMAFAAVFVPVPKAAVDEDNGFPLREDDVGAPRQAFAVQPEAKPHAVEHATDPDFRPGVPRCDPPHDLPTPFFAVNVCHSCSCALCRRQNPGPSAALYAIRAPICNTTPGVCFTKTYARGRVSPSAGVY